MRATFKAADLVLVGRGFPWPQRPMIGEAVQLNSGGPRMVIEGFDGEDALVLLANGDEERFPWACLKPWVFH